MKIYFSWAGATSYRVALSLRELINAIFPRLELWVPDADIQDGARWSSDLFQYLDQSVIGVICLDPSNSLNRWLQFEAGAIAKSLPPEKIRVLRFGLNQDHIQGPLTQFDSIGTDKTDILSFMELIRTSIEQFTISYMELRANLDINWSNFEGKLAKLDVESIPIQEEVTQPFDFNGENETPVEYLDGVEEKIIQLLFVNNGIDDDKISSLVYLSRGQCLQYLISMEKKNLIWSNLNTGVRYWYVTELGKKYLPGIYQT
jgi:hypothetical protein